jgi:hypothetical protein
MSKKYQISKEDEISDDEDFSEEEEQNENNNDEDISEEEEKNEKSIIEIDIKSNKKEPKKKPNKKKEKPEPKKEVKKILHLDKEQDFYEKKQEETTTYKEEINFLLKSKEIITMKVENISHQKILQKSPSSEWFKEFEKVIKNYSKDKELDFVINILIF